MPDDVTTAGVTEFEAESWPLEAAAEGLHQVIDGFQNGDTGPLVIGDGDQPVLVVLAIADLADFRARVAELLANLFDDLAAGAADGLDRQRREQVDHHPADDQPDQHVGRGQVEEAVQVEACGSLLFELALERGEQDQGGEGG